MRIVGRREMTFTGTRCMVLVDGDPLSPEPSQRVRNHSPDGFNWGYAGSGPAQLALALLLRAGCSDDMALRHHHAFKAAFLEDADRDTFALDVDVNVWLLKQESRRHQLESRR